jgi:hypothetical protein
MDMELLQKLDVFASQVFLSSEFRKFPYKSVSETLILVSSTLLRDILTPFSIGDKEGQIPEAFAIEAFFRSQSCLSLIIFTDKRLHSCIIQVWPGGNHPKEPIR